MNRRKFARSISMEGGESPLDVLSRAATMVQENQTLSSSDDSTKPYTKQTPKWKRERRPRPPEYPLKLESKRADSDPSSTSPPPFPTDTPLDMSVRQRGLPPSYAQTISNPCYRSSYRPPLVHNGVPTRDEIPSGISMCDPIIDEHFRRSLGSDYHVVFQNNEPSKDKELSPPPPISPPKSPRMPPAGVIELMDSTGMSVDDHFAKALGDTWTKLNRKEAEIKTSTSGNGLVSI